MGFWFPQSAFESLYLNLKEAGPLGSASTFPEDLGLPGALEATRNRVDALNGPTEGPLGAKEAENASIGPSKGPLGARKTGNKVLR